MADTHWGVYSVTLLIGSLQGLLVAAILFCATANRAANRVLALLIVGVVLRITPYTLGFAGYFGRYKWLNFSPFYWDLGFGPLLWLYVRQLSMARLPARWGWHFLPLAIQVGYYVLVFSMVPAALRDAYNDRFHVIWIMPLLATARSVSYIGYGIAAALAFISYQRWLTDHSGMREEFRLSWLKRILLLSGIVLLGDALLSLTEAWATHVPYRLEFPLYVTFAILVWVLGLEGWRHAERPYPKMDRRPDAPAPIALGADESPNAPGGVDWCTHGRRWLAQIDQKGWWRDPDVSLAVIAQRLGTNTAYLSRALNEGLGQNFSEAINGLRVAAAQERLAQPGSILDIAFAVGFASKASFNRVFKSMLGMTPSEFRRQSPAERLKSEKLRLLPGNETTPMP